MNYWKIIHKYIPPDSEVYGIYVPHVMMVTARALRIAEALALPADAKRFIEEAGMLHDIGIVRVKAPALGCYGSAPYMAHTVEGKAILESEGLPAHARVAENHIGIGGLTAQEIIEGGLPLPARDMRCACIEDEIISYADAFYSKNPERLFLPKTFEEVSKNARRYGPRQYELLQEWGARFGKE